MYLVRYHVLLLAIIYFNQITYAQEHSRLDIITCKHDSEDIIDMGLNTYLVNCGSYGTEKIQALKNSIQHSFKKGLSCLKNLGGRWKVDAEKLQTYFDPKISDPLVIRCQIFPKEDIGLNTSINQRVTLMDLGSVYSLAQAFTATETTYPGFILSKKILPNLMQNKLTHKLPSQESVLFHELTHMLGYDHIAKNSLATGDDIVYSMEECCFPESSSSYIKSLYKCYLLRKHSSK